MFSSASHAGVQHVQFCVTRWCSTFSVLRHAMVFNMFSSASRDGVHHVQFCVTRWYSTRSVLRHTLVFNKFSSESHDGVQHVQFCVTGWCSSCSVLRHTLVFNMFSPASHAGVQRVQFSDVRWCSTCWWRVKIFGTDGNEIHCVKANALTVIEHLLHQRYGASSTSGIRHKSANASVPTSEGAHH